MDPAQAGAALATRLPPRRPVALCPRLAAGLPNVRRRTYTLHNDKIAKT